MYIVIWTFSFQLKKKWHYNSLRIIEVDKYRVLNANCKKKKKKKVTSEDAHNYYIIINYQVNQSREYHMVGFYTLSRGKFRYREYSDILFGINSIDIMGC